MRAYQFEHSVPDTHSFTVNLPPDSPTGNAQVIVLFPESPLPQNPDLPKFTNIAEFTAWLETQQPSGRTAEEIDHQIREERESWED